MKPRSPAKPWYTITQLISSRVHHSCQNHVNILMLNKLFWCSLNAVQGLYMQERERWLIFAASMAGALAKIKRLKIQSRKQPCDICLLFRRKANNSINIYDTQSKYRVGIAPTVNRKIRWSSNLPWHGNESWNWWQTAFVLRGLLGRSCKNPSTNDYKSWLGQTKHQLNTILSKYFQTRKSSTHQDCRLSALSGEKQA